MKSIRWQVNFFLLIISSFGLLVRIGWTVCISIYYFTSYEIFTHVLADGLSLESEWQQVSSGFQDSSQYYGWSQKCCNWVSLDLSSNFQLFQPPFQAFRGPFQACQLQFVSPSPSCSTAFLIFYHGPSTCLSFCFLWFSLCGLLGW